MDKEKLIKILSTDKDIEFYINAINESIREV